MKEAEDLEQIQQKLFRQVKGRRKIEPLYNKKSLYANKDVFGSNIDKECEKILVKEEKHNKLKKNDLMKPNNIKINNNDINARRNYKIHCDKKEESDEEKKINNENIIIKTEVEKNKIGSKINYGMI